MNKHDYWKKRQSELWTSLERDESILKDKMANYYSEQETLLEREIGAYFSKYGKDNVIEYRDLLQRLSKEDKDLLYRNYDNFVKKYPQYKDLAPVRGSIYKLDRLQGLELSIKMQQLEIGAIEQEAVSAHLAKTFKKGYQETAKTMGFKIDDIAVKTLIHDNWTGQGDFSKAIWGNKQKLVNYLTTDFKNGIIRGDSFDKLSKQLRDRFSKQSNSNLNRLLTTEGTYINNQAMMKPFEDSGLYDEFEFVAVLDGHTSSLCKNLDGQKFPMKSKQVGVNFPPMHANCRSTFAMVIPDDYVDRYARMENESAELSSMVAERKNDDVLDKTGRKSYNQGINSSGAVYGKNIVNAKHNFTDHKEAEKYAIKNGVQLADFSKMKPEWYNAILNQLENVPQEARPVVLTDTRTLQQLTGIKIKRKADSYYGVSQYMSGHLLKLNGEYVTPKDGTWVGFNTTSFKTLDALEKKKAGYEKIYSEKIGGKWSLLKSADETIAHEFGHVMDNHKNASDNWEWKSIADRWHKDSGSDHLKSPSEAWADAIGLSWNNKEIPNYVDDYVQKYLSSFE